MSRIFVISGPSGVGKTSVARKLVEIDRGLRLSVSCTTRPKRQGEVGGEHYQFLDEISFLDRIHRGKFIEWARVHGFYYGTLKSELFVDNKDLVLEIDCQGARQVLRRFPSIVSTIFIAPRAFDVLEGRIRERGRGETEEEIEKRLQTARLELRMASEFNHVVVNDDFDKAVKEVLGKIRLEHQRVSK